MMRMSLKVSKLLLSFTLVDWYVLHTWVHKEISIQGHYIYL